MQVNATEFKNRVGKYLEIADKEEVFIFKNGKKLYKLVSVPIEEPSITKRLIGVLKDSGVDSDITAIEIKNERLKKYEDIT